MDCARKRLIGNWAGWCVACICVMVGDYQRALAFTLRPDQPVTFEFSTLPLHSVITFRDPFFGWPIPCIPEYGGFKVTALPPNSHLSGTLKAEFFATSTSDAPLAVVEREVYINPGYEWA